MRKRTAVMVLCTAILGAILTTNVLAVFDRVQQYKDGQFADVSVQAWYADEVKSAYETGLMNGKSDSVFSPDGTMTVAEGITIAARVNAIYNGKAISDAAGSNWYDAYVLYAKENNLLPDGFTSDYNRNIRRCEMAQLFAAALPDDYLAAKNNISAIPDVDENEEYFQSLLKLYKAGVVLGSDDYGSFYPTNPVKRCEAAAIINRAALPQNRLAGSLKVSEKQNEAFFLIDDYSMSRTTRNTLALTSGWNYENRFDESINDNGATTSVLADSSETGYVSINRQFEAQTTGVMTFEADVTLLYAENGARIYFENSKGENVLEIFTEDGFFHVKAQSDIKTDAAVKDGTSHIKFVADLDKKSGVFSLDGKKVCDFTLGNFGDFARIYYSTTKPGKLTLSPLQTHLYMNYNLYENFACGSLPFNWTTDSATVSDIASSRKDRKSLNFSKSGSASVKFDALTGKAVLEAYLYMPKNDKATLSFCGTSVTLEGNKETASDYSRTFRNDVWQCFHIEADTVNHTAELFINGKYCADVPFTADLIDSVTISFDKKTSDGVLWADDFKAYSVYDYTDYCPKPQKAQSDDYTLIMSVCSLWREGTHSGWDFVSPYDECTPLMGYYDEGIPEEADWEIKFLAEHGIDAMQYCWYSTGASDFENSPMKTPYLSPALHDGYFYAKYSDDVDFCLLWENQNFGSAKMTLDQFKTYIWDYWLEYYLTDSRYLTVNNKPVIEIYRFDYFKKTFGSLDECKKVVSFMRQDIKKYGYDDLILLFSDGGQNALTLSELNAIGSDGIAEYGWGAESYLPEYMKNVSEAALKNLDITSDKMFLVPTVATGRNILGWENTRTPLSTTSQHAEALEYFKTLLSRQGTDMLYFSTWNEFGEGHWLAPSGLNGFGYADEWRKAFTEASDVHDDIVPTIHQKNRFTHLYNDARTPIRPWLLETTSETLVPENVVKEWDFSKPDGFDGWSGWNLQTLEASGGVMRGNATVRDPMVNTPEKLDIAASDVKSVHIRFKSSRADAVSVYFITENDTTWNEAKSLSQSYGTTGEFFDMYLDATKNTLWTGKITRLRFDLINEPGQFEVEKIELLGYSESQKSFDVSVDGLTLDIPPYYKTKSGDEIYIAADPQTGIFSSLNLYYEWNRFDGVLYVKSGSDTEFVFTVGSDKVTINGKSKSLAKPFYLYDHLPVLPMRFLLDNAGVDYDAKDGLAVSLRGYDYGDVVSRREPFKWEFDLSGDSELWQGNNAAVSVSDGKLTLTAKMSSSTGTGYDAGMIIKNIALNASDYKTLSIRIKIELLANLSDEVDGGTTVYFGTNKDSNLNEAKTLRAEYGKFTPDADGFITLTYDLSACPEWKDVINTLRFDPSNNNGIYTIDYVRFSE